MNSSFMSLILFLVAFTLSSFTGGNPSETNENSSGWSLELESVLLAAEPLVAQDSFVQWIIALRNSSKHYRDDGDIELAKLILDHCLDSVWRSPTSDEEHEVFGWAYASRAYLYDEKLGNYLAAKDDYLNALSHFDSCGFDHFNVAGYVRKPLGNIYTRLAENEQAIQLLQQTKLACEEAGKLYALVNTINDLAKAYMNKGDFEEAIVLLEEGISSAKSINNLGLLYLSKAEAHLYLGDIEGGIEAGKRSEDYLQKAFKQAQKGDYLYVSNGEYLIGLKVILGELMLLKDECEIARSYFQQALISTEEFYNKKHREVAKVHLALANAQLRCGQASEAIQTYQRALISVIPDFDVVDFNENPKQSLLYADVVIAEAFLGKAQTANKLYEQTKAISWLKLAAETYESYFQWENLLLAEHQHDRSKLDFAGEIHAVGEEALNTLYQLQALEPQRNWAQHAFKILEQTKGIVLAESRFELFQKLPQAQNDNDIATLNAIKMQRSIFQIKLNNLEGNADEAAKERLSRNIADLDEQRELLLFQVRKKYHGYEASFLAENNAANHDALRHYLKQKECNLISYFVGNESMYVIAIHNDALFFRELDLTNALGQTAKLLDVLQRPTEGDAASYAVLAKSAYNALLGDLSAELTQPRWLILPDGILNRLPFEALIDELPKEPARFKALPYLVQHRTIIYAPSVKFVLRSVRESNASKFYLGVAPIFSNSNLRAFLSHSEAEVGFGKRLFNGKTLLNDSATKKRFLALAGQYQMLHISTHADAGTGIDNDGRMVFHSESQTEETFLLTPELFQVELSAQLVVLNACETGAGTFYNGEGVLSMARGFADAGAVSVLTNLWQVNHVANATILEEFYGALKENQAPHDALTLAKKAYLSSEKVDELGAHPYYWSAPVLIGPNADLVLPADEFPLQFVVVLGCGLLLLALVLYFRKSIAKK